MSYILHIVLLVCCFSFVCSSCFYCSVQYTQDTSCFRYVEETNDFKNVHAIVLNIRCTDVKADNVLEQIKRFSWLLELSLVNASISKLNENSFRSFRRLVKLNLDNNNLRTIPDKLFENNPDLEKINLNNNQLTDIPLKALQNLTKLKSLHFDGNNISKVETDMSTKLYVDLYNLYINNNHLETIPNITHGKLFHIYLSNNKISTFNSSSMYSNIITLNLANNLLTELTDSMFKGLGEMNIVNVSHNKISRISKHAFSSNEAIHDLDLSNNNLSILYSKTFNGNELKSLYSLNIANNKLNTINTDVFVGSFPRLKTLNLHGNNLKNISLLPLKTMDKLQYLDLSKNILTYINARLFHEVNLATIDLRQNRLKFSSEILIANPIRCNCSGNYSVFKCDNINVTSNEQLCHNCLKKHHVIQFGQEKCTFSYLIDMYSTEVQSNSLKKNSKKLSQHFVVLIIASSGLLLLFGVIFILKMNGGKRIVQYMRWSRHGGADKVYKVPSEATIISELESTEPAQQNPYASFKDFAPSISTGKEVKTKVIQFPHEFHIYQSPRKNSKQKIQVVSQLSINESDSQPIQYRLPLRRNDEVSENITYQNFDSSITVEKSREQNDNVESDYAEPKNYGISNLAYVATDEETKIQIIDSRTTNVKSVEDCFHTKEGRVAKQSNTNKNVINKNTDSGTYENTTSFQKLDNWENKIYENLHD